MVRFLIQICLFYRRFRTRNNRFDFVLLPRISRIVTNRFFPFQFARAPFSLSLSLIGDGRLVVRIIVKIMIRVGRAGNRCRARIGYTRVRASLGPPTRYMYIRPLSTPLDLDLALDLDNWPSIILDDHVHGNVVPSNKRWSIDNLSLRLRLASLFFLFLEGIFLSSFLFLNISEYVYIFFLDTVWRFEVGNVLEVEKIYF